MAGSPPYPRVLVLGQPFNHCGGAGITQTNLFEGWPRERLAAAAVPQAMNSEVCEHYVLGSDESVWVWPLSLVRRTKTLPSGTAGADRHCGPARTSDSESSSSRAARALYASADLLGVRDELRTLRMSAPLRAWIRGFAPDVVYARPYDLPTLSLADQVSNEFGYPLVVHMMDDWPSFLYREGILQGIVRGHMEGTLRSVMNRAGALLAISDAMAAEYKTRYGRTFVPIHNPVDLRRWDELAETYLGEHEQSPVDSLRVVYTGKVDRNTASSILDVAAVIADMSKHGRRIALQVNTPNMDSPAVTRLSEYRGVEVTPAGDYCRVPGIMRAADVLLLPLDFDESSKRWMRLSMPTKVSEYLASGRPILTYAPRDSAVAEYARCRSWSVLVDERDPAAIRRALDLLLENPALRSEMGSRARECAAETHDASRVRVEFVMALAAGIRGRSPQS